jgi:acetyltransferase
VGYPKAYAEISQLTEPIDLAIIATPAPTVPNIIALCVAVRVKRVIIISAGFKEIGETGIALEQKIFAKAQQGNLRIIQCSTWRSGHYGMDER